MIQLAIALVIAVASFAAGVKWHVGVVAERELLEQQARATDSKQQRQFGDLVAMRHVDVVDNLNTQLGDAYGQIARLERRACLDPRTVRLLNATGVPQHRGAAPSEPARAPEAAAAAGGGLRFASNISVGNYIAYCRTEYGKLSDQVNQILDIEEKRHPLPK